MADQSKNYLQELIKLSKYNLQAIGYQKLTVNGTAAALTVPAIAKYAIMKLESADSGLAARYLELGDITLPTTTEGIALTSLDVFDVTGFVNLINFRIIRIQSGTSNLFIQYYK